jgi:hypothetical protein
LKRGPGWPGIRMNEMETFVQLANSRSAKKKFNKGKKNVNAEAKK